MAPRNNNARLHTAPPANPPPSPRREGSTELKTAHPDPQPPLDVNEVLEIRRLIRSQLQPLTNKSIQHQEMKT